MKEHSARFSPQGVQVVFRLSLSALGQRPMQKLSLRAERDEIHEIT